MARRRDGRELFEVFREMKTTPQQPPTGPLAAAQRQPLMSRVPAAPHTLRLGDRIQVELSLSWGWVYGTLFFVFLALLGAFIIGRRTAPAPEPMQEIEASAEFAQETRPVVAPETSGTSTPPTAGPSTVAPETIETTTPAPVTGTGQYTLRVATYRNTAAQRGLAEEFVAWLKKQDPRLADARVAEGKSLNNIYVIIGSFETRDEQAARDLQTKVRSLTYKGDTFEKAYIENVGNL